jgi:LacI family transcriptional regulator
MVGRGADGLATIQDVADHAGVSRAAVSKVIRNAYGVSPAMRERVSTSIDELGYRPRTYARALRGSSFTIGVEMPTLANPFLSMIVEGATSELEGSGYRLITAPNAPGGVEGKREIEALIDRQVDGLIAISPVVSVPWLEAQAQHTPIVMIGRHDQSSAYDTVTGNDALGAELVMAHLLQLGHRRIAHLTLREEVTLASTRTPHAERLETYRRLMASAGLEEQVRVARVGTADDEAYEPTRELLSSEDPPTAIFVGNDVIAFDVLRALDDAGLSSAEVSVAGYDGIPLTAHPRISLTTVEQDGRALGAHAARLLLERIGGRAEPTHVQLEPRLVIRESTSPPHLA